MSQGMRHADAVIYGEYDNGRRMKENELKGEHIKNYRTTYDENSFNNTMAVEVRRDLFKTFWDRYSDKPDTNSMMLNHTANDLDASDRADILSSLPHLGNKDVVDIGAGIGRFTTVLANTARWVHSTDFIESFIAKNQERNAHLGNISYQIGDAVNLQMNERSVDLVFTNWLMMYLSDHEVIEFLFNAMRWLRPDGYLHLRESCSEPSTACSKTATMHSSAEANPTHYRFSSLYIKLLRTIRYRDNSGKLWKFDVQWSCSVPTYIQRSNNWRQVHWLTRKVPANNGDTDTSISLLLNLFSQIWPAEQVEWDLKLNIESYVWTDRVFSNAINDEVVPRNGTALVFTPRKRSPYLHVNSHLLAEKFTCNVWTVETNEYYYRTSLTKANHEKNHRVRFGWNESLTSSIDYWSQRDASFDCLISTELLSTNSDDEIKRITRMIGCGFKHVNILDVTNDSRTAEVMFYSEHSINAEPLGCTFLLISATL
ncbi:methyltransferase domain protein [Dictyocaulus viviparus]|uniref:phosphoethanolamine N-methyltransferase n=1 Tax=Dictyocaulus viviparus TaxID=29172 RepID=A0A0D8Y714_DICVI|nr:methyltransferase domain protein [Dictyocaulus viviparus]